MYQFITGPLLWISFGVFFVGCTLRVVFYIRGLSWQLDRVAYTKYPVYGIKGAARSIFLWLLPFGTRSWQIKPLFTLYSFLFHAGLVIVPVFLLAHGILIEQAWGISWPAMPSWMGDWLTLAALASGALLMLRRVALGEVRYLTTREDIFVWAVAMAPLLTGYIAAHTLAGYKIWLIVHILCGEVMLIAIPFTKLSHVVLFFCSRAQIGMDFGIKRGGMKGTSMNW